MTGRDTGARATYHRSPAGCDIRTPRLRGVTPRPRDVSALQRSYIRSMEHALASRRVATPAVRGALIAIALTCGLPAGVSAATGARPAGDAEPATLVLDHCSWDRPGVNPFMGDVVAAVDRYRDIPPEVRARLKARMAKRAYDDLVSIRRDSIAGRGGHAYRSTITDMHFGTHQLCRSVTRASWSPAMQERGLVYCDSGHCILVPTVCRNVSRVSRRGVANDIAENPPLLEAAPPGAVPAVAADDTVAPLAALVGVPEFGPLDTASGGMTAAPGAVAFGAAGPVAFDGGSAGAPAWLPPTIQASSVAPAGSETSGLPVVTAVPEPQTWASLIGGLAALALFARHRAVTRRAAGSGSAR